MVRKKPRRNFSVRNESSLFGLSRFPPVPGKGGQGHIWCHDGRECRVINHSPQHIYNILYHYKYLIHYLYIFLAGVLFLWFIAFQRR